MTHEMKEKELVVEVKMSVVVRVSQETLHKNFRAEVGEVAMEWAELLARKQEWDELIDSVTVLAVEEET